MQQQKSMSNGVSVYEIGVQELHKVSQDEAARKAVDAELNEARGREPARLHVTLRAISEADRRAQEHTQATLDAIQRLAADLQDRASQLSHLIESFEMVAEKRFAAASEDLKTRADALTAQVNTFSAAENLHFDTIKTQVGGFQTAVSAQLHEAKTALWTQADKNLETLSSAGREQTAHIASDVRALRDELVRLIDNRLNQADASFAAVRGDVEVVKYLVMDLIKDRIGRTDPKQKPF